MRIKKTHLRIGLAIVVAALAAVVALLAAPAPQVSACCCSIPPESGCQVTSSCSGTTAVCESGECTRTWHCTCTTGWGLVSEICPLPPPGPSPFVDLFSCDPAETPELTVPNADGQLPCGAGLVDEWGNNVFDLTELTCCAGITEDATVYCLDAEGHWTNEFVSEVTVSLANGTVAFQATQHGMCAIFPAE